MRATRLLMGMPITVEVVGAANAGLVDRVFDYFAGVDRRFSTYRSDSEVSAINQAELTKLCQSVSLGGINLKITAGDADKKVQARALVVDSDLISGDADFGNINVGQDASTFDKVTDPATGKTIKGGEGVFGQQADTVDIDNLRQNNYATTAAKFTLPHLRMSFTSSGC